MMRSHRLVEELVANEGEVSPLLEEELAQISLEQADKIDAYDWVLKVLAHNEEFFRAEARRMQKNAQQLRAAQDRLKERLLFIMNRFGKDELAGGRVRLKICNSPESLVIEHDSAVPPEYQFIKTELNHEKIKEDLKKGKFIEGCRLERGQYIRFYHNTKTLKGKTE